MKTFRKFALAVAAFALPLTLVSAEVPHIISYQGRVTVGGVHFDGIGQFKFALVEGVSVNAATATAQVVNGFIVGIDVTAGGSGYTAVPAVTITDPLGAGATATATVVGGAVTGITLGDPGSGYSAHPVVTIAPPSADVAATYWSNDGSSTDGEEPTTSVPIPVTKGNYSVLLGDSILPNMSAIEASAFSNKDVRLRVWFSDGSNGFQMLAPDRRIAAVGYALAVDESNLVESTESLQAQILALRAAVAELRAKAELAPVTNAKEAAWSFQTPSATGGTAYYSPDLERYYPAVLGPEILEETGGPGGGGNLGVARTVNVNDFVVVHTNSINNASQSAVRFNYSDGSNKTVRIMIPNISASFLDYSYENPDPHKLVTTLEVLVIGAVARIKNDRTYVVSTEAVTINLTVPPLAPGVSASILNIFGSRDVGDLVEYDLSGGGGIAINQPGGSKNPYTFANPPSNLVIRIKAAPNFKHLTYVASAALKIWTE